MDEIARVECGSPSMRSTRGRKKSNGRTIIIWKRKKLDGSDKVRSCNRRVRKCACLVERIPHRRAPISLAALAYGTAEHGDARVSVNTDFYTRLRGAYACSLLVEMRLYRDGHSQMLNCAVQTRASKRAHITATSWIINVERDPRARTPRRNSSYVPRIRARAMRFP